MQLNGMKTKRNDFAKAACKRAMSAALVLGMALAATGCSGGQAAGSTPSAAAEQAAVKVGIMQFAPHPSLDNCREGFLEGLKRAGYVEGENLKVIYENAQADMSLTQPIAEKLVREKSDLICAIATPAAMACAPATETAGIPLLFNAVSEPVDAGLVDSFEQPGGHITGMSDKLPSEKQVALIQTLLPEARTVGILYTTSEANALSQVEQFRQAAEAAGMDVKAVGVATSNDIASALDSMLGDVDCMQNLLDNTVVSALPLVLEKAESAGVPVFGSEEEQVVNGCIASEGIDYLQLGIDCGLMAASILDGASPADMPIGLVTESRLTVNADTLAHYGLDLPEALKDRAALVQG